MRKGDSNNTWTQYTVYSEGGGTTRGHSTLGTVRGQWIIMSQSVYIIQHLAIRIKLELTCTVLNRLMHTHTQWLAS